MGWQESYGKKQWEFEIDPEEEREDVAATPALSGVNVDLCYRCEIVLSTRGEFFVCWRERQPKTPDPDEFFSRDRAGRSPGRVAQYKRLEKKYPAESYARQITLRQAYEIIARFWLPREFHIAAGLHTVRQT